VVEQRIRFGAQDSCELVGHVDAGAVDAALKRPDIGSVDADLGGERLPILMNISSRDMLDIRLSATSGVSKLGVSS
jgi:hypothetical protein